MKQFLTLTIGTALALTAATSGSTAAPLGVSKTTGAESVSINAPAPQDAIPHISQEEAKKDFESGAAVFVDTRGDVTFKAEHIKGAISVPMGDFTNNYKKIPAGKKIIAYCSCPHEETSSEVVRKLAEKGIKNAYALTGGIQGWKAGGNPVESAQK